MKPKLVLFFLILLTAVKAQETKEISPKVGDISFDAKIDNPDFHICPFPAFYNIFNYNGEQYRGDIYEIREQFKRNYLPINISSQTGYVTIRFMVNCEGKTGLFRMQEMDMNYQPFHFDTQITEQLIQITQSLQGWNIMKHKDENWNYYQYLTIKIENGSILEILP